ncbi:hypothetical protein BM449_06110 [Synechococcus sp. SynAce01]|nr:hypothetical protein BM449_06110 [Synechococcus sp. SynAce01]
MQKAIIPHAPKPPWQHVSQQQPEKLSAGHRADMLKAPVVLVAEADLTSGVSDDILLWQNAPIEIATQINEGLISVADIRAVHHLFIRELLLAAQTRQS